MKENKERLYVVSEKALPEVLLQVVKATRLLDSEKVMTVGEATEAVGISRSSFYKYKDEINSFYDNSRGKTISFLLQIEDEQGLLAAVLKEIAKHGVNILTIHQSIPVNGIASLSISLEVVSEDTDVTDMMDKVKNQKGVQSLKVLAKE